MPSNPSYEWQSWGGSVDASLGVENLEPGSVWEFQVQAISETGVESAWSNTAILTVPIDTEGPVKTTAPICKSTRGTIQVGWDGKALAAPFTMDIDTSHVEVYQTGITNPVGTIPVRSVLSAIILTDVVPGTTYEFKFVPVDRSKNKGPASEPTTVTAVSVLDQPIKDEIRDIAIANSSGATSIYSTGVAPSPDADAAKRKHGDMWFRYTSGTGVITQQWFWNANIATPGWVAQTVASTVIANLDAGKITAGTIAAARIAAGSISADKIAAGAIDATKLTATAIDGKTISGAEIKAGTIYTGSRTSSSAGKGIYMSGNGFLNALGTGSKPIFTVSPDSDYVRIGDTTTGLLFDSSTGAMQLLGGRLDMNADGAARTLIEPTGRMRFWGSNSQSGNGSALMLDIKPNLAGAGAIGDIIAYVPIRANSLTTGLIQAADTNGLQIYGSGASEFKLRSDSAGAFLQSINLYTREYTTGIFNVAVRSNGVMGTYDRSRSELKLNIQPIPDADESLLDLEPVIWYDKNLTEEYAEALHQQEKMAGKEGPLEADTLTFHESLEGVGFRIEDFQDHPSLQRFLVLDHNGEAAAIQYGKAWIALLPIVKKLRADVDALTAIKETP